MNTLTQGCFEAALRTLHKRGKPRPEAKDLLAEAWHGWWQWRDAQIGLWADHILDSVPAGRLLALDEKLFALLCETDLRLAACYDEPSATQSAWTLACLRWLNRESHYALHYSVSEVEAWLAAQDIRQLSLFDGV